MNRINDPESIRGSDLDEILARGVVPTIQFSRQAYTPKLLKDINALCREHGSDLEVRFYGHYSGSFDASVLRYLPDVSWLSVDCLQRIEHENHIGELENLARLSIGVYYLDRPDFLEGLKVGQLVRLALSDSHRKNFDLAPLENGVKLEDLYLNGHTKNIAALASLPSLRYLSLGSISKKQSLEFVSEIENLKSLTIILGGRETIDEVNSDSLTELSILRVRGLESVGDIRRFPRLRRLQIEDQIRLKEFSVRGTKLEDISVHNCKNLTEIDGLLELRELCQFRTSRTSLDLETLLSATWPDSMDVLALYSSSQKWNDKARMTLDERGYREFGDPQRLRAYVPSGGAVRV